MARVYNFSAGPSVLPESVLHTAAEEMLDYKGSGQSVMEMSHRSKTYDAIIKECEALLREVMGVPDNYKVLFLQGGASSQFAMVPLNLMNGSGKADFVLTGQWASKAQQEAARYGEAHVVASSKDKTYSYIPALDPAAFTPDADYFHICRIIPSTAPALPPCLRPAMCRWWRMSRPASCPSPSTSPASACSTPARRKIWGPPA